MKIHATFMDGAGNSFLVVDGLNFPALPKSNRAQFVRKFASRVAGFRPDGVVFVDSPIKSENQFSWDFYNLDGSFAEFCGNAARCVSLFFFQNIRTQEKIFFETGAGVARAFVQRDKVQIIMPIPAPEPVAISDLDQEMSDRARKLGLDPTTIWYLDSGVPHLLCNGRPSVMMGGALRPPTKKLPSGTNVTFWEDDKDGVKAQTFERGVEGFTQACGTGALAIGVLALKKLGKSNPVMVTMPGGKLSVEVDSDKKMILTGEAKIHFQLETEMELE